jgi:hypothetical protein
MPLESNCAAFSLSLPLSLHIREFRDTSGYGFRGFNTARESQIYGKSRVYCTQNRGGSHQQNLHLASGEIRVRSAESQQTLPI